MRGRKLLPIMAVVHWNKLPRETVWSPCLEICQMGPGKVISQVTLVTLF